MLNVLLLLIVQLVAKCVPCLADIHTTDVPSVTAPASSGVNPFNQLDPQIRALLKKVRNAERTISMSGEQVTILYRPDGKGLTRSSRAVYRDTNIFFRCEYHSPPDLAGQTLVTNLDRSWEYSPQAHVLKIGPAVKPRLMTGMALIIRSIRSGDASLSIIGADKVVGRPATILHFTSSKTNSGSIKLWIDAATGFQLRTEIYDSLGQLQSVSYYTKIVFNPIFRPGTFDPPQTPPGTQTEIDKQEKILNHIPLDSEAGFHVFQPVKLPRGYKFKSASAFKFGGQNAVAIRYTDGVSVLSIIQGQLPPGSQPDDQSVNSPRVGIVLQKRDGMRFAVIGTLSQMELSKVIQSLH